eukprot:comp5485_c0_seq1/m.4768 comp5485_c0_seq1/g.4768  ORF comp5485_c0_seq1/g.4768 comp5485_c0_seq1/m.4768 type:complete len:300 (+) comp5485_c0_seq1:862-1761(+)
MRLRLGWNSNAPRQMSNMSWVSLIWLSSVTITISPGCCSRILLSTPQMLAAVSANSVLGVASLITIQGGISSSSTAIWASGTAAPVVRSGTVPETISTRLETAELSRIFLASLRRRRMRLKGWLRSEDDDEEEGVEEAKEEDMEGAPGVAAPASVLFAVPVVDVLLLLLFVVFLLFSSFAALTSMTSFDVTTTTPTSLRAYILLRMVLMSSAGCWMDWFVWNASIQDFVSGAVMSAMGLLGPFQYVMHDASVLRNLRPPLFIMRRMIAGSRERIAKCIAVGAWGLLSTGPTEAPRARRI